MTAPDATQPEATQPEAIRIVIANDHPLFRGGVVRTLYEAPDMEVVGGGADAA
jgi:hypothetical protein